MLCLEKAKHKFFVSFMIEILPDETCHIQDKRSAFVLILNRIVFENQSSKNLFATDNVFVASD